MCELYYVGSAKVGFIFPITKYCEENILTFNKIYLLRHNKPTAGFVAIDPDYWESAEEMSECLLDLGDFNRLDCQSCEVDPF